MGSQDLKLLMQRFFWSQDFNGSTDVTFKLPDGSESKAHKIILAVSSEVFYSQFFGPLADKTVDTVNVAEDIDIDSFRIMIESIYDSGDVPDLEINEYLDLLEVANFYLLHDIIDECNTKLCEHIRSLEIQELIDWTYTVSKLSIHDQVYESCGEAILAKLSRVIKEEKWDCISTKVQNKLIQDIEYTDVWKGDLILHLQVLKRLTSLELNSLFPKIIMKSNTNLESYFESSEDFHEFILNRFKSKITSHSRDLIWLDNDMLGEKLKNHLDSIETQDSVISDMYSLLKGDGLDLDRQFQWDKDYFTMQWIERLEGNGFDWDKQEDKEHYWRLLEFARIHQLDNLADHCYLRLSDLILDSFPENLAQYITRASITPGGEELFKLGIHVFVEFNVCGKTCTQNVCC